MDRNILTTLINGIVSICDATAQSVDARTAQIHFAAEHDVWQLMGGQNSAFTRLDTQHIPEGRSVPLGGFTALETVADSAFVSDLSDLHIDLLTEAGKPVARLVLSDVPRNWKSRAQKRSLDRLAETLSEHLAIVQDGPRIFAAGMLALMDQLIDLDANVNSPTLTGFLRVISGKPPTRSQLIALQISGLVESSNTIAAPQPVLITETARDIIARSGLGAVIAPPPVPEMQEEMPQPKLDEAQPVELLAHAKLRIMERDYLVAEHPVTEVMYYRPTSAGDWAVLSHGAQDGWAKIAAEIIQDDLDILAEFVRMHLIRRRDLPTNEIAEAFELIGKVFWMRLSEDGQEFRLDDHDWQPLAVDPDQSLKERAIQAALELAGQTVISLDKSARDWAHRMAHSVQISPVMQQAAQ